jgi:hypothetical protein
LVPQPAHDDERRRRGENSACNRQKQFNRRCYRGILQRHLIVDMKVKNLAARCNARPMGDPGDEHVFAY